MIRELAEFISQSAKCRGAELAKEIDFSKDADAFSWAVYNSACLGCSRRVSPPGVIYSTFQRKYVMHLCRKCLKRCPARPLWDKWHTIHANDNTKGGAK